MGAATRKSPKMILGKKINPYLGLLIVFLLWFVFASPYFLHHLVPFPTRQLVAFFEPWNQYDKYAGPVKNNAMPDVVTQIYPWKHFTITELKKGHVPLWNPFNFSGNPALANFQTAIFSPFNLFYFLLPFIDAWSIVILLQPLLAGFFVYLLSRELKISTWGAAVSGVTFMFCGFMVVWMAYGTLALAIAFLPLALFAIERYWRTRSQRYSLLLALSIAISIFSGHFQTSLYLLITVIAYVLYKFMLTKDHKTMFILYLSICLGVVISLIQIIPTIVFYTQSFRSNSTIVDGGIPLYYLITSFAPDFFGNPVTRNDWVGFYAERASFVGIIPLYLAGLSLFERKKRDIIFFAGLALVALLFAVASPLQSLLALSHIPVISSSNPTRIIVLCSFALSVLSGFGLDYLCESLSLRKRLKECLLIFLSLVCLLVFCWLSITALHFLPQDKAIIAKHNLVLPTILFFITGFVVAGSYLFGKKKVIIVLPVIFVILISVDSLRFAQKWMPFDSSAFLFPDVPVIKAMQQTVGTGRAFGGFGTEVQTYYGIPSVEGYDPLYIQRYGEFIKAGTTGNYTLPDRSLVQIDRHAASTPRLLNFLSVNLIFQPKSQLFADYNFPVWGRPDIYKVVYNDDKFLLYQNLQALPRARLYFRFEVISKPHQILSRFYQPDFAYDHILLLGKLPSVSFVPSTQATGSAVITDLEPTKIVISVTSSQRGLLFMPDPDYPNWHATVNKKPTEILRADYAFRAVEVPKGKSEVVFTYSYF